MTESTIPSNMYTNLGSSGLKISKIIFGCMGYGNHLHGDWVQSDDEEAFKVMKAAYDSGVRTFDTANVYSQGASEEMLGRFLKKYSIPRENVVIMTKVYFSVDPSLKTLAEVFGSFVLGPLDPKVVNKKGLNRKHIFDSIDASLKRLQLDYVDVLQIHRYDPTTPDEEIMRALNDVVNQGKVRYIGSSSMYLHQFVGLQQVAEKHGWHKFISMQDHYNLLYREEEREMIPYCKKTGVGIIPWSPIAGGVLARPLEKEQKTVRGKEYEMLIKSYLRNGNENIIGRVEEIAKKYDVSMATVATAWNLAKGVMPIVGVSKVERLHDVLKALEVDIAQEDFKYLEDGYSTVPVTGISFGD